jgi:hypothetical protein
LENKNNLIASNTSNLGSLQIILCVFDLEMALPLLDLTAVVVRDNTTSQKNEENSETNAQKRTKSAL